jgi:superfamily I DNA/RNA helicase
MLRRKNMALAENKPTVAISAYFLKAFAMLPNNIQRRAWEFLEKFRENPKGPAINYEKIKIFKDPNLRSVRIDLNYRGIILSPEKGNVYMLLWIDHHDKAYKWAENKVFKINPATGGIQIIDIKEEIVRKYIEKKVTKGLFAQLKDSELLRLGAPEDLLPLIRSLKTDDDLDNAKEFIPAEALEALYMLAAGFTMEEVLFELEKPEPRARVDIEDFAKALENPDTKRRFFVVEDALELAEVLKAPLEQWRVFLHPSQRKLVEMDASGPVRILGGAGTGKTVVAMHRAKWLSQNVFNAQNDRILFTTFSKNLAADINENLKKICSVEALKRIEVINLDAWVVQLLNKYGYEYDLAFDDKTDKFWENAMNLSPQEVDLGKAFYKDEWQEILQAQGIGTKDEYIKAKRIGQGKKLGRVERLKIWPVFEEYRTQLNQNNLKEMVDATRDTRIILENKGDILPYKAIIVDEAQDMGTEAFKLIRQMIPETRGDNRNDIFIVGDAHQRIYNRKMILSQCGINIKGRSRKLRVNYRTTEETRKWAIKLLEGREIDDLDGGIDDQKGYKSLLHGVSPERMIFKSFDEETKHISNHVQKLQSENVPLNSICLVARTGDLLKRYEAALKNAGLKTYFIQRSKAEDRSIPGLRLATMHRVKGLEFDYVIIAAVNDGIIPYQNAMATGDHVSEDKSELRERALLYVAATRAKKEVLITCFGKQSIFL